jgi:hypothetical protein
VLIERLLQPSVFHDVRVQGAVIEGVDAALDGLRVLVHDQFHAGVACGLCAQAVHVLELPGGIDMQQRETAVATGRRPCGQVQHDRRVLADRVEHHRPLGLRRPPRA